MSEISYIKSERGGLLLTYQNYLYRISKKRQNTQYWKCVTDKCSASVIIENKEIKKINNHHNHQDHASKITRKKFALEVKESARENIKVPVPTLYK